MKRAMVAAGLAVVLAGAAGCTREARSPDAIRRDTANATAAAAKDAKAVAQGVIEGLKRKGPVNINKASSAELQALPGISARTAETIIADRPYDSGAELVRRRIVTKTVYDQIADKITAQ